MKQKKGLLLLLLALAVVIGGASVLYSRLAEDHPTQPVVTQPAATAEDPPEISVTEEPQAEEPTQPEPIMAPDFTVYDADGNPVHLSDFAGKPVVLNFWASWCGPCQREMPHFEQAFQELGEDVHFVMLNMTAGRETQESADAFVEDNGYTFPVYYDTQSNAAMTYGAYSIPMTFFINAQGHAITYVPGAINLETLLLCIDLIRE